MAVIIGEPGRTYRLVACVLRPLPGGGWEILNDAGHASSGVASVAVVNARYLKLTYNFTASKVGSSHITPDEYFAAAGLRMGASVGLTFSYIYLYSATSGTAPIDPNTLSPSGNIWVTMFMEVPA